ncbi:MAG: 50S ribosomal protein L36, partial [Spirochaetaceae bacterium]|nr:50S ribosomal protein L36 [Spirochaetaceae bacterium]
MNPDCNHCDLLGSGYVNTLLYRGIFVKVRTSVKPICDKCKVI